MSEHLRQQIRDQVVSTLQADPAVTALVGDRVMASWRRPLSRGRLPAILVYTDSEEAEVSESATPTYDRALALQVECLVEQTAAPEDLLDSMALAVEQALHADRSRGGLAEETLYTGCEVGVLMEGNRTAGSIRLAFRIDYRL